MRSPDDQVLNRPVFDRMPAGARSAKASAALRPTAALAPAPTRHPARPAAEPPVDAPEVPSRPLHESGPASRPALGARAGRLVGPLHRSWLRFRRGPLERPRLLGELLIVLVLLRVYDYIRTQGSLRRSPALEHGREILNLESTLRIGVEARANQWAAGHHEVSLLASWFYQYAHITVTMTVLAWIWWRHPASYRKARNSLVVINALALSVFFLYPVAPPRLLGGTHTFVDTVALAGFGATHGGPVTADQYGAMPSLHIGWALWTAMVGYRLVKRRPLRIAWLGYPLITLTVIVVTGNHYVLDAVAGAVLALGAQWLTHLRRAKRANAVALAPSGAG